MIEHFTATITTIQTVPHDEQRYNTAGDWRWVGRKRSDPTLHIFVSRMSDPCYEFLVAVHELVEAFLCRQHGVSEEAVTAFDVEFEKRRDERRRALVSAPPSIEMASDLEAKLDVLDAEEAGADLRSPYREEHLVATTVERMLAAYLGVEWGAYERAISSLS